MVGLLGGWRIGWVDELMAGCLTLLFFGWLSGWMNG